MHGAKALSAEGGGKSFELSLYVADGSTGTLDPAFQAHVQPLHSWALACWQGWQNHEVMEKALVRAQGRVLHDGQPQWSFVSGPAAATVASAARIGWTFSRHHQLLCDDVTTLDLYLDPPIVVADAVQRAVRRWRLKCVAELHPELIPTDVDIKVHGVADDAPTHVGVPLSTLAFVTDPVPICETIGMHRIVLSQLLAVLLLLGNDPP